MTGIVYLDDGVPRYDRVGVDAEEAPATSGDED